MIKEMSNYEIWSLIFTAAYDLLTLGLLTVTVYIGVIQRFIPNISFYYQRIPNDIEGREGKQNFMDFVLENRGIDLKNVQIKSEPDYLGWGLLLGSKLHDRQETSDYFSDPFPYLYEHERKSLFWCDTDKNKEVFSKPFKITVEFDNPMFFFPKRLVREFNFTPPKGIVFGVNNNYDIHNVALETARIKIKLGEIESQIEKLGEVLSKSGSKK
jgi:hypothetical protein